MNIFVRAPFNLNLRVELETITISKTIPTRIMFCLKAVLFCFINVLLMF